MPITNIRDFWGGSAFQQSHQSGVENLVTIEGNSTGQIWLVTATGLSYKEQVK
jgi:hypothetical protein